jgi:threonine dehydrogenase-like Zn-dependent dehydrogenase
MPRALVAVAPRTPALVEYDDPPLRGNQVRVRSEFSAAKHGTEMTEYRGETPFTRKRYDAGLGIFLPTEETASRFPLPLGNMTVGTVSELGPEATRLRLGDRVFAHLPIRETHTVAETSLELAPQGMSAEAIVYVDPAEFALAAVRDAQVRLGETVAVFGMGAIGLMVVQMAKLSGATWVGVVDPLPGRREAGLKCGADVAYDPRACDAAFEIKRATGRPGVDVAIEASGSYQALHEAIRCVHLGGRVAPLAYYMGEAKGLWLGEEFHFNRPTVISTRACSDPNRDHPMWDDRRIIETAFTLLRDGRLKVDGLIKPCVPFEQVAEAYRWIDENPDETIKLGVTYP